MIDPPHAVHHLALQVRDLPVMERFYTEVLRLPFVRRWPAAGGGDRAVWVGLGGGAFLALETITPDAQPFDAAGRPGFFLLAVAITKDVRGLWIERLAAAGHPIYQQTPYTIYARDPEGNRIGLSHFPEAVDAVRGV